MKWTETFMGQSQPPWPIIFTRLHSPGPPMVNDGESSMVMACYLLQYTNEPSSSLSTNSLSLYLFIFLSTLNCFHQ